MIERTLARRHRRAAEIKRPAPRRPWGARDHGLDDVGVPDLRFIGDLGGKRADIDIRVVEKRQCRPGQRRVEGHEIALDVDDGIETTLGVDGAEGLEDAIRARRVIGPGHHRLTPRRLHRIGDLGLGAGDEYRAEVRLDRPAPDMDDHRLAADLGQRLAREAGRSQSGGDQDDGIFNRGHGAVMDRRQETAGKLDSAPYTAGPAG